MSSENDGTEKCKALSSDIVTLRVDCSSDLGGKADIKGFTSQLRKDVDTMGLILQWSFIIPQMSQSPPSSCGDVTDDPYRGPECCVTVPADIPVGDWPYRTKWTIPTIFAELYICGGSSLVDTDVESLKEKIFCAIKTFFCPKGRKVWVTVTSRRSTDSSDAKYSQGVEVKDTSS